MRIDELKAAVEANAQHAADFKTTAADCHYADNGNGEYGTLIFTQPGNLFSRDEYQVNPKLNKHAFSQLNDRLFGPPTKWILGDKCPEGLRGKITNRLLEEYPDKDFFVRVKNTEARAVLSHQYTVFDHTEFVDLVAEALDTAGVKPTVFRPTIGDFMSTYILLEAISFGRDPLNHGGGGEGLHPAIYISNSEIGTGAARTMGGLYRSVCENGVIYGWERETAQVVIHKHFQRNTLAAIVAAGVIDALKMSEEAAHKFMAARDQKIEPQRLDGLIGRWASTYGISVDIKDNWLSNTKTEWHRSGLEEPTIFDVVNAATYVAHEYSDSPQQRENVERMAGRILQGVPWQRE